LNSSIISKIQPVEQLNKRKLKKKK